MSERAALQRALRRPVWGLGVAAALIGCAVVGLAYRERVDVAFAELERSRDDIARKVQAYEQSAQAGVARVAADPRLGGALQALSSGYRSHIPEHLRDAYVALNPYPVAERSLFSDAQDGSGYTRAHAQYHPILRKLAAENGCADLYLLTPEGEVVYSVTKGLEFADHLRNHAQENGLASAFFESLSRGKQGGAAFSALKPYVGTQGNPERFGATAIFNGEGNLQGVLAVRFTGVALQNALLPDETALALGRAVLVEGGVRERAKGASPDGLDRVAVREALRGQSGYRRSEGADGAAQLVLYRPLTLFGNKSALLVKADEAIALGALKQNALLAALGLVLAVLLATWAALRSLSARSLGIPNAFASETARLKSSQKRSYAIAAGGPRSLSAM